MRLSLDARKAIYAEETSDFLIILLTLSHPDLDEAIYISTDSTERLEHLTTDEQVYYGTVSQGKEFVYCPMEINLPDEAEDSPPATSITIDNVGRELIEPIRNMMSSPDLTMQLVLSSNLNNVEGEIEGLKLTDVEINAMSVTGTLSLDMFLAEPFPYRTFTPSTAQGCFK